ncbi:MAG: hypothetical protein IJ438_04380 [Clostridia bacterium]|nr:hypothetical protein [Clostridia bacterium]
MRKLVAMLLALCLLCGMMGAGAEEPDMTLLVGNIAFDGFTFYDIDFFEANQVAQGIPEQELVVIEQSENLGLIFIWMIYDATWAQRYDEYNADYYGIYSNNCIASELNTVQFPYYLSDELSVELAFQWDEVCQDVTLFDGQKTSIKEGAVIIMDEYQMLEGKAYGFGFYHDGASYSVVFSNVSDPDKVVEDIEEFASNIRPYDGPINNMTSSI